MLQSFVKPWFYRISSVTKCVTKCILDLKNDVIKDITENKKLTDQYEKNYGPLTVNSEYLGDSSWKWIKSPWPWEGTK